MHVIHGCSAHMILASANPWGGKIFTAEAHYPRMVHADCKTHRIHSGYEGESLVDLSVLIDRELSRNGRSSRAVPVHRLLEEARSNPYVPNFMANGKGMSPTEQLPPAALMEAEALWRELAGITVRFVTRLNELNVHKQWANRPLEWFGYIDMCLSSTNWNNFLALRDHPAAQQEMQDLAECIRHEIKFTEDTDNIQYLQPGEWHLPYIFRHELEEHGGLTDPTGVLRKISSSRLARVSVKPFDGNDTLEAEFRRYGILVDSLPVHASPTEHPCTPDVFHERKNKSGESGRHGYWENPGMGGNLGDGWIQLRKTIPNEVVT
jgi:hypothetical protein